MLNSTSAENEVPTNYSWYSSYDDATTAILKLVLSQEEYQQLNHR